LTGWPAGYRLSRHDELDSTRSEARRLAEGGEQGPLWIIAERQTAGRGRRGRVWETLSGNLAATLLLRPDAPANTIGQLSFAAALAVADTAAHFAPGAVITVKWPNDVLAEGRKLAGILLES
jgi:BirA family biotin operon repressor/biotin-[acetyl-CoA-carboxylase] ligase